MRRVAHFTPQIDMKPCPIRVRSTLWMFGFKRGSMFAASNIESHLVGGRCASHGELLFLYHAVVRPVHDQPLAYEHLR